MNSIQAPGTRAPIADIEAIVTDPWDFSSAWGTWRKAVVLQVGRVADEGSEEALLIRLQNPVEFANNRCEYFIAAPRYESGSIETLASKHALEVSLTWLPDERAKGPNPFDLSWWRGGAAGLGSLRG